MRAALLLATSVVRGLRDLVRREAEVLVELGRRRRGAEIGQADEARRSRRATRTSIARRRPRWRRAGPCPAPRRGRPRAGRGTAPSTASTRRRRARPSLASTPAASTAMPDLGAGGDQRHVARRRPARSARRRPWRSGSRPRRRAQVRHRLARQREDRRVLGVLQARSPSTRPSRRRRRDAAP